MSGPRTAACSVVLDNEMWVMGGEDGNYGRNGGRGVKNMLATVEVYSPKTNSWRSCTAMSQRRRDAVAGVVGGRLVVAGGYCIGTGRLSSAEAYDGTQWTPLPPLPHAAYEATACVLNGRLYVMGGAGEGAEGHRHRYNKLQVLEMTEENGLAWTVKADMPVHRHDPASIVHEGKIMLIGGCAIEEHASSVMVYDEHTDSWATAPPLPVACQGRDDYKALHIVQEGEARVLILHRLGCLARRPNGEWAHVRMTPPVPLPMSFAAASLRLG